MYETFMKKREKKIQDYDRLYSFLRYLAVASALRFARILFQFRFPSGEALPCRVIPLRMKLKRGFVYSVRKWLNVFRVAPLFLNEVSMFDLPILK